MLRLRSNTASDNSSEAQRISRNPLSPTPLPDLVLENLLNFALTLYEDKIYVLALLKYSLRQPSKESLFAVRRYIRLEATR